MTVNEFEDYVGRFTHAAECSREDAIKFFMSDQYYNDSDVVRYIDNNYGLPYKSKQFEELFNAGVKNLVEMDWF